MLALKARGVRFIGHRAMLARCLDEVDALQAALRDREALLAQRDTAYEQVDQAQAVVRAAGELVKEWRQRADALATYPRTAAEWITTCRDKGHWMHPNERLNGLCPECAEAYARQQMEAALEEPASQKPPEPPGGGPSMSGIGNEVLQDTWAAARREGRGRRCPHRCPVCGGRGEVDQMLYTGFQAAGTNTEFVLCRTCKGTGVIWHDN